MKKTDIALIIIIISISAGIAWWVGSATLGKANNQPIIVRTIDTIKTDEGAVRVDPRVFSPTGINPTVETSIKGEDMTSFIDDDAQQATDDADTSSPEDSTASPSEE